MTNKMKLNRRQFFVGSGAMLATGCAPCHSVCEARDKEWSLDNRFRLRMKCPGIVEPVKVWVAGIGPTHQNENSAADAASFSF